MLRKIEKRKMSTQQKTTPMAIPVTQGVLLKPQILWNRVEQHRLNLMCKFPKKDAGLRGERPLKLRLLLLPRHLHLRAHSLPLRCSILLPRTPLHPLLRPRKPRFSLDMSSLADSNSNPTKTVRAVIKGRVQGVFYRNWTVDNAKELGLKGWVRNRRDGSVEALFSGSPEKVQEMEQRCRRGPPDAMVTRLDVFPSDEDPGTGFERSSTV